jgi:inorganic phosphate transporter, PiT family
MHQVERPTSARQPRKTKLDKDFKRFGHLERGLRAQALRLGPMALGLVFLVAVGLGSAYWLGIDGTWPIVIAATVVAAYMALNIGANDVANNMSPAVGSRALTIGTAVVIAAICEAAGALIAGGEVVATVSSGIIDPAAMPDAATFVVVMLAALLAAALWINIATLMGAPVSTTHSVIGGVLGAGVVMAGVGAADWWVVARIVASWVVSPVLGGAIAAGILYYITHRILEAPDKLEAARRRVPLLLAVMAGAFATYLQMKGLARIFPVTLTTAALGGLVIGALTWWAVRPLIDRRLSAAGAGSRSVGDLFTIPVIAGAALLSFAHGSNDVANAIGPLAGIYAAVTEQTLAGRAPLPFGILLVGALGIAIGLLLYGPALIRTVGSKITKLNRVRAFCVTLSAAITVILASTLGLPVSSTHIAIGALFGVGFLREYLANRDFPTVPVVTILGFRPLDPASNGDLSADEKLRRRYLVRRAHLLTIIAAWLITVPASGLLAACLALALGATGLVVLH